MAGKESWLVKIVRFIFSFIAGDFTRKTLVYSVPSIIFDFFYAGFAAVVAIIYKFPWLGMMSVYYVFLTCMKCRMLYRAGRGFFNVNNRKYSTSANMRSFSKWLFFMDLLLAFDVYLMTRRGITHNYPGFLVNVMGVYVFIKVTNAIVNMFRAGKSGSFITIALRKLGIVEALVSVLALNSALNYKFGAKYDRFYIGNVLKIGIAVFVIILFISLQGLLNSFGKKAREQK